MKENGFGSHRKRVRDISARLIVNTASMKLRKQEIDTLINQGWNRQRRQKNRSDSIGRKDENTTRTYVQQLKQRCDEKATEK